jgi:hypothetical protein
MRCTANSIPTAPTDLPAPARDLPDATARTANQRSWIVIATHGYLMLKQTVKSNRRNR